MLRESFLLSSVTITAPPPPAVATFSAILSAIFWLDQSETSIVTRSPPITAHLKVSTWLSRRLSWAWYRPEIISPQPDTSASI